MLSCLAVVAVIGAAAAVTALFLAVQTRSEVRALRARFEAVAPPGAAGAAEPAAPTPTAPVSASTFAHPPQDGASAPVEAAFVTGVPPEEPPFSAPTPSTPPSAPSRIDWESLVGVRLFSWIAGIALVLAAVFLFKYSVDHGWLRPAVRAALGLATGVGLLVVSEMRMARAYRFTANAMDGAGIAILYATLFALYARWGLWPAVASFGGMLLVTAVAVYQSTRRDSLFIALLGLIGGFATPALLSSGENRPIALFSYLLLLNGGISWIAWRKQWPLLTGLSVALTVVYQWAWVDRFLTRGQLPLAAGVFVVFALVGAASLWPRAEGERSSAFRRIGTAGAVLPLLFAFFTAIVPEYGAEYHVLFAFLFLQAVGLAAIAAWRGPLWLHGLGGAATLITFFIWTVSSYTPAAWPGALGWLGAFVVLYLLADVRLRSAAVYTSSLLFFALFSFALREPLRYVTLTGALFALLTLVVVYALWRRLPNLPMAAMAFGTLMLMSLDPMSATAQTAAYAVLLALVLVLAYINEQPWLPLLATPFYAAAVVAAVDRAPAERVLLAGVLLILFTVYAFLARRDRTSSRLTAVALVLANVIFFIPAYLARAALGYEEMIGILPLAQAVMFATLLFGVLRKDEDDAASSWRAILAGAALAFFNAAIAVQLEKEWITIAFALEAAALAWLFTRIPHRGLLTWSSGLAIAVLVRLVFNPWVFEYHMKTWSPLFNWYLYAYLTSAAAMFLLARLVRAHSPSLMRFAAAAGTLELFVLLNIQIADYYSTGRTLTFNFVSSSLAQDLTYTIGWAVFAMATLVAGIVLGSRATRIAALGLLLVTVLKCFLHDLARLGGLYRVGSLFGLAVALVIVGVLLQKFVTMKRPIDQPLES